MRDATATVHEEPVERLGERLHTVVVGDERKGGLRLAGGDERVGRQAVDPRSRADRPGDLGVDVEREPVTRMVERPVALGVDRPQTEPGVLRPRRVRAHEDRSAHHADHLRRHTDPRVTLADDLLVDARPLGVGVGPAAHVEPLEHDRAAEVGRVGRHPHEDTRAVGRLAIWGERPPPVGRALAGRVRRRRARGEVLVLAVPGRVEVGGERLAHEHAGAAGEHFRHVGRRAVRAGDGRRRRLRRDWRTRVGRAGVVCRVVAGRAVRIGGVGHRNLVRRVAGRRFGRRLGRSGGRRPSRRLRSSRRRLPTPSHTRSIGFGSSGLCAPADCGAHPTFASRSDGDRCAEILTQTRIGGPQATRRRRWRRVRVTKSRSFGDVLPRVLVHASTDVLQLVAALGVASALGRTRVAEPSRHLDDHAGLVEQEVDPGDVASVLAMHHLRARSRESGSADDLEEPPFEHRVTARVDDQLVDEPAAPPARTAQRLQPGGEHLRRRRGRGAPHCRWPPRPAGCGHGRGRGR